MKAMGTQNTDRAPYCVEWSIRGAWAAKLVEDFITTKKVCYLLFFGLRYFEIGSISILSVKKHSKAFSEEAKPPGGAAS